MARGKKKAKMPAPEVTPTQAIRDSFTIEAGVEIPPIVRESQYPWEVIAEGDPGQLSFFVACNSEDHAEKRRSPIQSSGRNYYVKRKINRSAVSRVVQENGVWGVRSWAVGEGAS